MTAQTISILLVDGSPLGVRIAEMGNTVTQAIAIPRKEWNEAKKKPEVAEIENVGIYFLLSNPSDDGQYDLYIGKSSNVRNRIDQHMTDDSKDYWNHAVCFVARGGGLNTAHADYMENKTYQLASNAGRSNLQNKVTPIQDTLSAGDKVKAEQFIADMKILLTTLGFPVLEEKVTDQTLYFCENTFARAKGYYTNEGFVVKKGSSVRKDVAAHVKKERLNREQLISEGILTHNEGRLIFARDYRFSTPSAAAVMVRGAASNGWLEWKDEKGKTLDENVRENG